MSTNSIILALILAIGLEPIIFYTESDFKSDVSTNSTKRVFILILMAQFDSLIIFSLFWSTLFILTMHYNVSLEMLIPFFFGAKKFRAKKLDPLTSFNKFLTSKNIIKTISFLY